MKTCGPFTVELDGDAVLITCHGPDPDGCPTSALPIAPAFVERLRGPLSRFTVSATAEHRAQLAEAIDELVGSVKPCARCEGSGVYRWRSRRGELREGVCFRCDGSGIDPRQPLTREQREEARRRYAAWRADRRRDDGADEEAVERDR